MTLAAEEEIDLLCCAGFHLWLEALLSVTD